MLEQLARHHDSTVPGVVFAWLLRLPCRPHPIVGSHRQGALEDAVRAQALGLSDEEWFAILAAAQGHEVP